MFLLLNGVLGKIRPKRTDGVLFYKPAISSWVKPVISAISDKA
jgi:hypothetical protein